MKSELIATKSITTRASGEKVWDALTNPSLIKKYLFGTDTVTDWKVGSPIIFQGIWEGKSYQDKGIILAFEKGKILKYSYWSSMAGTADVPENYSDVTFTVAAGKDHTALTVSQNNCKSEESRHHSVKNWGMILDALVKLIEE